MSTFGFIIAFIECVRKVGNLLNMLGCYDTIAQEK